MAQAMQAKAKARLSVYPRVAIYCLKLSPNVREVGVPARFMLNAILRYVGKAIDYELNM